MEGLPPNQNRRMADSRRNTKTYAKELVWKIIKFVYKIIKFVYKFLWKFTWRCVEFWTPLSFTFILLWLLYSPNHYRPHVDSAALASLHLTNASLLWYDLSANLSFRNSHSRLGIWYLDIGATAFYGDNRLGATDDSLPSFYQGPKNTTVVHPTFRGAVVVQDPLAVAIELSEQRTEGTLYLMVRVYVTLMYKAVTRKSVVFYSFDCWLLFPPLRPGNVTPVLFFGNSGPNCWRAK